jgi:hypothetical protein
MVEQARLRATRFPIAVVSFNLKDKRETALQFKGVIVVRRLDKSVVHYLLGLPSGGTGTTPPAA